MHRNQSGWQTEMTCFLRGSRRSVQAGLPAACIRVILPTHAPVNREAGTGRFAMRITTAVAAGVALLLSGLTVQALESSAKATSKLSADALWAKIGDFCGISKWHPAVEKCELSADGKTRTLALKGGGTIVEALVKMDAAGRSYTYSILSGPLPVANYTSTISVAADGAGSMVTWIGNYDAKGANDADAKKTIDGVYDSGLKALTAN